MASIAKFKVNEIDYEVIDKDHRNNVYNPHKTTKEQVGLGRVDNMSYDDIMTKDDILVRTMNCEAEILRLDEELKKNLGRSLYRCIAYYATVEAKIEEEQQNEEEEDEDE